jgi:hypothetical protein
MKYINKLEATKLLLRNLLSLQNGGIDVTGKVNGFIIFTEELANIKKNDSITTT